MEGQPGLVPFDAAVARVDALLRPLAAQCRALAAAAGRVLAEDIRAAAPIPAEDHALVDGFAVLGEATLGAAPYNPLDVPLATVAAGAALPPGTDSVIALDAAAPSIPGHIAVVEAAAPGTNVARRGRTAAPGALLAVAGTRLAARHLGLLAAAGIETVPVVRRPRVEILLVAAAPNTLDGNSPMLGAAVARDGGVVAATASVPRAQAALAAALAGAPLDLVLVTGGSGPGPDDHAAAALAESGELVFHGLALDPGGTAGFGRTGNGVPVVLLPGLPVACLFAYELLAGRAVRRLGGRDPALPYAARALVVGRKLVSAIGTTEIRPIRIVPGGTIEPLPSFAEVGLGAAAAADGFIVIPAEREGYPPGSVATAYLYDDA